MGYLVFLFVGLVWSPDGGMERPIVQVEMTRAACEADRVTFLEMLNTSNGSGPPSFRKGFAATPCAMVPSTGGGKAT